MRIKDIAVIGTVVAGTFPLVYLGVLFATGNATLVFNPKNDTLEKKSLEYKTTKYWTYRDSLLLRQSQAFLAAEKAKSETEEQRKLLVRQQERITFLQSEVEEARQTLVDERKKMERIIAQSDSLEMMRIRQLAKIYGSMRATEAAQILETLDADLLTKIINAIGDERQKSKIMAGISKEKAALISERIGAPKRRRQ